MATMLQLSWYADLKTESDLRRMAVVYDVRSVPLSKIDFRQSQVNGARTGEAILPGKVEDYAQGFRNGDTFPRVVVHKTATGYVILGGNQRCEALRRLVADGALPKDVEIEAYVVDTTDKLLLEIIARSANVAHGEGMSKEERIQHAMYCVRRLGMTAADASKAFMVSPEIIRIRIKADEMRATLQRAGVEPNRITNDALVSISKLDFDESAQVKVGHLAAQHSPKSERIKQVVDTLAKQRSSTARVAKLKEFERELAAEAHDSRNGRRAASAAMSRVPARPRRDRFLAAAANLANFLESGNAGEAFVNFDDLQISTQADTQRAHDLIKRLRFRLGVLAK